MTIIHLDFETFSAANLKKVGAFRYAGDPSTEILLAAVAVDGEDEVALWMHPHYLEVFGTAEEHARHEHALELMQRWVDDPEAVVFAHNAQFEHAIARVVLFPQLGIAPPRLEQWRCTAAMARRAALPANLADLAIALNLHEQKDTEGIRLIRRFGIPVRRKTGLTRTLPGDDPEEFRRFGEYCRQDVRTERDVAEKLHAFRLRGAPLRTFQLDMRLNTRGVPVDVPTLRRAQVLIDEVQATLGTRFRRLTGLAPTQRDRVLTWLQERGYPGENLQAVTVDRYRADTSWGTEEARLALELRSQVAFTAVKKVTSMLECECGDGRVRGTLLYHGAGTGRWSGRLIQPQNFKRPTLSADDCALAYMMIQDGCSAAALERNLGVPAMEALASVIRLFIRLPDGALMNDADYSSVEARIVCWLAGQEDALRRFTEGVDSYVDMAAYIFNKRPAAVTDDERWLGKQTVLGCGYQMGAVKFYDQALDLATRFGIEGVRVTPALAEKAVAAFRRKYDRVSALWAQTDLAARRAIMSPGRTFPAGPRLDFTVVRSRGIPYLVMRMPSKRNIVYPWPRLEATDRHRPAITFYGKLPMRTQWGRVKTYGGKLTENATQGIAADVMAHGAATAEDRGFRILTLIHDEALSVHDGRPVEEFCAALTDLPEWAEGLPLEAEGEVIEYYQKL